MSRELLTRFTCDRCKVTTEIPGNVESVLPSDWRVLPDTAGLPGDAVERIELCPSCQITYADWRHGRAVAEISST